MALIDRLLTPRTRANPVQVVEAQDAAWGRPQETFAPPDYGDYVATSNDVYSTAMLRAKMLAKLPLDVYQGGDEPVTAGPLHDLINRPNPHYTRRKFLMMHELSLALWGQTYIVMETGGGRLPQELWWVKPTLMRPVPDKEQFIRGFLFTPPNSTDSTFFAEDEVVWIAYPNPIDEMSSLAPMAAVRLAADVSSASMKANRNLFRQGLMGGGFITPPDRDMSFSDEQARDLERLMERRFTGADKAHRWQVLRYALSMQAMSVTPKDAEFIDGMNLAFRHVARGMGVPPPLVGDAEFATLANLRVYERMFWEHTGEFAARFIEDELNRQLIPRFGGSGRVEFDLSDVVALQEDETEKWSREKDQIALGAITINEWREQNGLSAVEWGDAYWAPMNLVPTSDQETPESEPRMTFRGVEHQARWYRAMEERRDDETAVERELIGLFTRQEDQVLQQLRQRMRSPDDLLRNPFNRPEWASRFRDSILPHLRTAMRRIVGSAGKLVGIFQALLY